MDFNTQKTETTKEEWYTPPSLIRALGEFDLDPCICEDRPWDTAAQHFTKREDGLTQDWFGRVWCNPPYGRETFKWMKKLAAHGNGIALIFARTETKGFHREIWDKASSVFFFEGRLNFFHKCGTKSGDRANAPSCLVSYGKNNVNAINLAYLVGDIQGYHCKLREKR